VQHQAEFLRVSAHAQRKWETSKQADEQVGNKQASRTSEPYEQCEQTKRERKHAATHRPSGACAPAARSCKMALLHRARRHRTSRRCCRSRDGMAPWQSSAYSAQREGLRRCSDVQRAMQQIPCSIQPELQHAKCRCAPPNGGTQVPSCGTQVPSCRCWGTLCKRPAKPAASDAHRATIIVACAADGPVPRRGAAARREGGGFARGLLRGFDRA
jgi:hypothetical protein